MNEHQQPVRNCSEDVDKHPSTSLNAIHRISASPRSIKTQIAKVSYTSPVKLVKKCHDKKPYAQTQQYGENVKDQESKAIDSARNELSEKKEDREKERKKFTSYIKEIAKSKKDEKEDLIKETIIKYDQESKINKIPEFRRCRTEILSSKTGYLSERRLKTRMGAKVRSKSSQPSETKSHELLPSSNCIPKRKSYNVEEARKFLEDQKRKRRLQHSITTQKVNNEKAAFEKDQIKKRLEELRKNSKAIIIKNVKRKKNQFSNKNGHINAADMEKTDKVGSDFVPVKPVNKHENNRKQINSDFYKDNVAATVTIVDIENPEDDIQKMHTQTDMTVIKNKDSASGSMPIDDNILVNPQKHLGLLRKPETKNHSFSAISEFSFDKENIALEMMTPKLANTIPKRKDIAVRKPEDQEKPVEVTYRKPITIKNTIDVLESDEHKNIKQAKDDLESHHISIDITQSKLNGQKENGPQNDLPHLLKSSAVQIYPYNFIMAVRRKLEALSDIKKENNHTDLIHHKTTFTNELLSKNLESGKKIVKKPLNEEYSQSINHSKAHNTLVEQPLETHLIETDKDIVQNQNSKSYSNHSQSEVNSALSSISIQLMSSSHTSKTFSKTSKPLPMTYSKPRTDSQPSEDETTISSSIFSSPERNTHLKNVNIQVNNIEELKGSLSPISLEGVRNRVIVPNNSLKRAIASRHVNPSRGDALQFITTEQKLAHNKSIQEEVNINQLLDDFNRSLSQVIAVNDRLKTTINKTHAICSSESNIEQPEDIDSKESDEYTEDFEQYSSQPSPDAKLSLHKEKDQTQAFVQKGSVEQTKENLEYSLCSLALITEPYPNPSPYSSSRETQPETKEIIFKRISDKRTHKIDSLTEKGKQIVLSTEKKCLHETLGFEKVACNKIGEKEKHSYIELMDYSTSTNASEAINTKENKSLKSENIVSDLKSDVENRIGQSMKKLPSLSVGSDERKQTTVVNTEAGLCKHYLMPKQLRSSNKILEMFNSSNLEISVGSTNNDSLAESTCRYSNVGLYEKLIRNETSKSEYLTALLKMREKALYDRTKGQIAWLEVQKERCKSKGLLQQITTIKKKQRGVLLKMQKERDEIKRLLQSTTTTTSTESSGKCVAKEYNFTPTKSRKSCVPKKSISRVSHKNAQLDNNENGARSLVSLSKSPSVNPVSKYSLTNSKVEGETTCSVPVVRANYDLESSRSLEELLRKRESDLRCRREHVERLMEWHRQLDQEEAEVQRMENELLKYNAHKTQSQSIYAENVKSCESDNSVVPTKNPSLHTKTQRRLKEIENSLRELNSISNAHQTLGSIKGNEENRLNEFSDCVQISGSKLNKLWRRLTAQVIEKYEPNKLYDLSKTDLECLYEAAKVAVIKDFARNEGRLAADLLEKSTSILSNNLSQTSLQVSVPSLNLCTSPEPSVKDEESVEETSGNSLPLGNYSPSTADEDFHQFTCNSGSAMLCSSPNQSSDLNLFLSNKKSEINLPPSMRKSTHLVNHNVGLMRSFSDTVIYNKDRSQKVSDREILKKYKNKSKMKSIEHFMSNIEIGLSEVNVALSDPVSPLKQTLYELTNSVSDQFIPALEPTAVTLTPLQTLKDSHQSVPNNEAQKGKDISVKFNNISELCPFEDISQLENENVKSNSQEQETQCNSSSSSEDNNIVTSNKYLNPVISTLSALEHIQIDSNRSDNNIDDSSITHSLKEDESFNSKTFVSEPNSVKPEESAIGAEHVSNYEDDFEIASDEATQIEDLSLPHFESIMDVEDNNDQECTSSNIEKRNFVIPLPSVAEVSGALKIFNPSQTISDVTQSQQQPPPPPPPPLSSMDETHLQASTQSISNATASVGPNSVQLMPDIINELEIRRCQQIFIESEKIKQFENSSSIVPYMYVREIPNKPPPPYVPPAHGSPMTTIFPSEERIKEISFRRTHELYCELLKTDYVGETGEKLPSVMDEKITNIYERIILDICREYLEEHIEVLKKGNPINFHTHLAFFNPPNRLRCIQESVYKEVRRCLAMDKSLNRRTPMYSVYGQRAKRDHIGKIIIQEMYDEDNKWCNFHREENEVVELIIYEMIGKFTIDTVEEVFLEEGGTVEGSSQDNENDVNAIQLSTSTATKSQEITDKKYS